MATQALDFIPEVTVALTVSQTLGQQLGFPAIFIVMADTTTLSQGKQSLSESPQGRATLHILFSFAVSTLFHL